MYIALIVVVLSANAYELTMKDRSPIGYVRSHWAGDQGLGWSFWVNLVALRLVISIGQAIFSPNAPGEMSADNTLVLAIGIFVHVVVLVWQVVGVLRACDRHIRDLGSPSSTWGAQFGILVVFWLALSDLWGVWIMTLPVTDAESFASRMASERAGRYDLSLSDNGTTVLLRGDFALGVTKAVAGLIAQNPSLETLALTSNGGNIFEARGLAKLARDNQLDTLVAGTCSSACTVAFIGGFGRRIQPGARLGFHQYRLDAGYDVPFADPRDQEARDRELFESAGVAKWFLDRIFLEPPDNMWFPSAELLEQAGVLTAGPHSAAD